MNIPMSARFAKSANLEINQAPDGYVIYQSDPDRVHFLNMSAAVVLELCDGEHSLQEIIEILQAAYDLDTPPLDDFKASVTNLISEGLIKQCPE